ncbi:MAG: cytochrome c3 family protein [Candidatus Nitrospinota bacterium M3_3B_026]
MTDTCRRGGGLPWIVAFALAVFSAWGAEGARVADVSNTKHNLSTSGPGTVKATEETQICVFCHTPHGAELDDPDNPTPTPLWNREYSAATYTPYTSKSMQAAGMAPPDPGLQPDGSSKLCLSCHDGTIAIGAVNVLNGQLMTSPIGMEGVGTSVPGEMPGGTYGETSGFTRFIGTDLTNDHPISFTYDTALATADGELRDPADTNNEIDNRTLGVKPLVPLESNKVQCISCHDPHIRETDDTAGNINNNTVSAKFLRLNRFQASNPIGGNFDTANDLVCLACHDKLGQEWARSVHANDTHANEIYKDTEANLREFPTGIEVWQAACMNCHDTHTVQGARRLLREGTDDTNTPKQGGNSAIEQTCYQCHTTSASSILQSVSNDVPDIYSDFQLTRRMPITETPEAHDINDADFTEDQATLGYNNLSNRHAECTDCHNPHRIIKKRLFTDTSAPTAGDIATHASDDTDHDTLNHTNIASGVLRGTFGVEPVYNDNDFNTDVNANISFQEKQGVGSTSNVGDAWVTREYQICLKCHSHYGYNDDNQPDGSTIRPALGYAGGTPSGTNGMQNYTNQAREFNSPISHKGEVSQGNDGGAELNTNNHRSWHPVMRETGRTASVRGSMNPALFLSPWNNNIGGQTMYCTDCHGSNTALGTVAPSAGRVWGPHGSENNFLLKGVWDTSVGSSENGGSGQDALCFRCHDYNNYANPNNGSPGKSGFSTPNGNCMMCNLGYDNNLHIGHARRIGYFRCKWCHVMVPHGWKNKALLVNRKDLGPEVGLGVGTNAGNLNGGDSSVTTMSPYYYDSKLYIDSWAASGNWDDDNCGGGDRGMGGEWMPNNCASPPP